MFFNITVIINIAAPLLASVTDDLALVAVRLDVSAEHNSGEYNRVTTL